MSHRKGELSDAALDRDKQHPLILLRANKSRGSNHWDADDYDVRLGDTGGEVVGRIMRHPQTPKDQPWFWTITARFPSSTRDRGYTKTREQAMTRFRLAWDPMPTDDAAALVEWGKRNIQGEPR